MKVGIKHFYAALQKYGAVAKINLANRLTYPIDIAMEVAFLIFVSSIVYFLHRTTVASASPDQLEYLSLTQIMWITFFANIFAAERGKGVSFILKEEILSGQIAYQLNRPYSYMLFHFAQNIGTRLPSMVFGGTAVGLFLYGVVGMPHFSLGILLLGMMMVCIGIVMGFLMQFCIGLCAFWIGDIDPLRWIYMQIIFITSGVAVPIALLPSAIKKFLLCLPFSNIIYGAARVIVGCQQSDLFFYLGLQLFWLIVMLVITRFFLKIGVKNVVVGGG